MRNAITILISCFVEFSGKHLTVGESLKIDNIAVSTFTNSESRDTPCFVYLKMVMRFTLSVGVSSPPARLKSVGKSKYFLTWAALLTTLLAFYKVEECDEFLL